MYDTEVIEFDTYSLTHHFALSLFDQILKYGNCYHLQAILSRTKEVLKNV